MADDTNTRPSPQPAEKVELVERLERTLVDFVETPNWSADAAPPEDNADWRAGYEAAQSSLREALKPWWPFGGPLALTASPTPSDGLRTALEPGTISLAKRMVCIDFDTREDAEAMFDALERAAQPSDAGEIERCGQCGKKGGGHHPACILALQEQPRQSDEGKQG